MASPHRHTGHCAAVGQTIEAGILPPLRPNPRTVPTTTCPHREVAYNIAKLRSGKMGESNISRGGISMFRKSFMPIDRSNCCFGPEMVCRIGIMLRPGNARYKIFLKFCNMKMSGNIPAVGFGRIPSLHGFQLLFWLGLNPVDGLPFQPGGLRDC